MVAWHKESPSIEGYTRQKVRVRHMVIGEAARRWGIDNGMAVVVCEYNRQVVAEWPAGRQAMSC